MSQVGVNKGAAFDLRNLEALKLIARRSPEQGLAGAAKQMEGLFIQMMLKSMRQASFKGGLFDNVSSQMFTSMYDQQISQDIAAQGTLGFADQIVHQLGGARPSAAEPASLLPISTQADVIRHPQPAGFASPDETVLNQRSRSDVRPHSDSFISRMLSPARKVARLSGIPHQLIIAQAALESGWGNREIMTASGKPSHNLFGIKATPDWKGEATEVMTSEYINGSLRKVKASFKVYKNYAEALSDHSRFLTENPRYQKVINNPSIENAAHALQKSGYATDPDYAKKLINIMHYVQNNLSKSVKGYKALLDELF